MEMEIVMVMVKMRCVFTDGGTSCQNDSFAEATPREGELKNQVYYQPRYVNETKLSEVDERSSGELGSILD